MKYQNPALLTAEQIIDIVLSGDDIDHAQHLQELGLPQDMIQINLTALKDAKSVLAPIIKDHMGEFLSQNMDTLLHTAQKGNLGDWKPDFVSLAKEFEGKGHRKTIRESALAKIESLIDKGYIFPECLTKKPQKHLSLVA